MAIFNAMQATAITLLLSIWMVVCRMTMDVAHAFTFLHAPSPVKTTCERRNGEYWFPMTHCNSPMDIIHTFRPDKTSPSGAVRRMSSESDEKNTLGEQCDAGPDKSSSINGGNFDLRTALFCAGLAFDAYSEPKNSSRWEKGSKGLNVAFQSAAYTRSLYKGIVEVTALNCTDLPDEDDTAEGLLSGGGVDAYLLVAVAEGKMKEDVDRVKEQYSSGVPGLRESAHVGRSSTAWSNVDEKKADANLRSGKGGGYYVSSTWVKGGQAFWKNEQPFYLYVADPKEARLVFTVMDEDLVGEDSVVGSAWRKLSSIFPFAGMKDPLKAMKLALVAKLQKEGKDPRKEVQSGADLVKSIVQEWEGTMKLTSKPRKKDKKGQVALGAAAGALVAGPAGAAVGGLIGNWLEEDARGKVGVRLRYVPIPNVETKRQRYKVKGGLPGVYWGHLYERYLDRLRKKAGDKEDFDIAGNDLEFCVFVISEETGCSCAVYRSLNKKMIAVTFRGTCAPKDLITDASIIQTPWVKGEDPEKGKIPMVHIGFRKSLNSVARRVKELILAAVPVGETLSDYDLLVTGHSLGGALATLFATDVAEYGMDAGRRLPQLEPSEPWWSSLVSGFTGTDQALKEELKPPRPNSLRLYSFGSPRVGDDAFLAKFNSLQGNGLDEVYRVVNDEDIVARLPRSVNALGLLRFGYDHCGATALISLPKFEQETGMEKQRDGAVDAKNSVEAASSKPLLWVEGESSNDDCPVRDGTPLTSPLASGMLLGDLVEGVKNITTGSSDGSAEVTATGSSWVTMAGKMAETVTGRLQDLSASDITSIFGVKQSYAEREAKIIQSVLNGKAITHHLEDEYYGAMGRACGFIARVGEELVEIEDAEDWAEEMETLFEEKGEGAEVTVLGDGRSATQADALQENLGGEFALWDAQVAKWKEEAKAD